MMKNLILINFKTYIGGSGREGLKLAKSIYKFKSSKYQLAISPQTIDLKEISKSVKIPVFSQHLDNITYGSHTGSILPESVKKSGATGTLINHSEKRIELHKIRETIEICKRLKLKTVVCASSLSMVKKIVKFTPDYIAYEPKKLIGKNISVTSVNPKVIVKAVKIVSSSGTKLLAGAGIHSRRDIKKAIELGASGVLIAHKVVKAKKVRKVLKSLL